MKIAEGFILRQVAGSYIVVAVGKAASTFNGIVNLNDTGAFLWKQLEDGKTEEQLVSALLDEYEVEKDVAEKGVTAFIDKLTKAGLIIE